MKPSNKERREVAVMLRCDVPTECNMTDGELLDEITDIIMPRGSSYSSVEEHDAAFVNRLADLIEPEERTWVSVDDRLPDSKGEYIVAYHPCYWDNVYTDRTLVGIDSFRGKASWAKRKYQHVTHWMPKPETPRVVEDHA